MILGMRDIIVVSLQIIFLQGRLTQNLGLFPILLILMNLFLDQNSLSLD